VDVALEDARVAHLPDDHHGMMDWSTKLPLKRSEDDPELTEPHGFATIHVKDGEHLNAAVAACEPHGWSLRVHYPEPDRPEPSPESKIAATLAEMRAEIDALKARAA
jgi:hypothetical protein